MSAVEWLATASGLLLVAGALREVFHTLLHPSGTGQITPAIFRLVWRTAHRLGARAMDVAGPLATVLSIAAWTGAILVGAALVYWPHLPGEFQLQSGIAAATEGGLFDALYVSAVTISTLGFGDIVPEATSLRIAMAVEALTGFALLTASISWVLSIYPALMRRRSLAARIGSLLDGQGDGVRLVGQERPVLISLALLGVADQLGTARVDLVQYPSTYFFHAPAEGLALPLALQRLRSALDRDDLPQEVRTAAGVLNAATDALVDELRTGPFGLKVGEDADVLDAFAADHGQTAAGARSRSGGGRPTRS